MNAAETEYRVLLSLLPDKNADGERDVRSQVAETAASSTASQPVHFAHPLMGQFAPVFGKPDAGAPLTLLVPESLGPLPVLPAGSTFRLVQYVVAGEPAANQGEEIERQRRAMVEAIVNDRASAIMAGPGNSAAWAALLAARQCGVRFILLDGQESGEDPDDDPLRASADAILPPASLTAAALGELRMPTPQAAETAAKAIHPMMSRDPFFVTLRPQAWRRIGHTDVEVLAGEAVAFAGPAISVKRLRAIFVPSGGGAGISAEMKSELEGRYTAEVEPGSYSVFLYRRFDGGQLEQARPWTISGSRGDARRIANGGLDIRAAWIEGEGQAGMAELRVHCGAEAYGRYWLSAHYVDVPAVPSWHGRLTAVKKLAAAAMDIRLSEPVTAVPFARPKRGGVMLEVTRQLVDRKPQANGVTGIDVRIERRSAPSWFADLPCDVPSRLVGDGADAPHDTTVLTIRAASNMAAAAARDDRLFDTPGQAAIDLGPASGKSPEGDAALLQAIDRASGGFGAILAAPEVAAVLKDRPSMRSRVNSGQASANMKDAPRILIAAHDFRFAETLEESLLAKGARVYRQSWRRHTERLETGEGRALHTIDTVFCDWCLGNAVWWSKNLPAGKRLVVRVHAQELATVFPARIDVSRVDRFVFVSPHIMREAQRKFAIPEEKCEFARIAPAHFLDLPPATDARRDVIGMVGFTPWIKRPDLALDFVEALSRRYPVRLILRGAMPSSYAWMREREAELQSYVGVFRRLCAAQERGLVSFEPFGDDMAAFYRKCGWLLSMSDAEGCHAAVAEAGVSGVIPLIRRWPGSDGIYPAAQVHSGLSGLEAYFAETYPKHAEVAASVLETYRALYDAQTIGGHWWRILMGPDS